MKTVTVSAAVIFQNDRIFATQRGYGEYKDWWEFPGGKVEKEESPENAVVREIREELNTEIAVRRFIRTIEYDYPGFHLVMHCFLCRILSGELTLREHEDSRWLAAATLDSVNWLPADKLLLDDLRDLLKEGISDV